MCPMPCHMTLCPYHVLILRGGHVGRHRALGLFSTSAVASQAEAFCAILIRIAWWQHDGWQREWATLIHRTMLQGTTCWRPIVWAIPVPHTCAPYLWSRLGHVHSLFWTSIFCLMHVPKFGICPCPNMRQPLLVPPGVRPPIALHDLLPSW